MQLTFEPVQVIGTGSQPAAIHTAENIVQVIFVGGGSNQIYAQEASTPMGDWTALEFNPAYMICDDVDVEYMKVKYVASSIFVVWKNDAEVGEVVPYQPNVVHTLRHRFAVWTVRQDLSKYLIDGNIDFNLDDPITKASISFENPKYIMSHEDLTNLTPGTCLTLFFRSGDSARYIMGRYYIDSNDMSVGDGTTSINARNTIGKFLKDQSFNENTLFNKQNLELIGVAIMDDAGVPDYWVGTTATEVGMKFPPEMNFFEGLQELVNTTMSWKIEENFSGQIGFGDKADPRFTQPETFIFERNVDIFSRSVTRDDQDAYARVCVKAEGAGSASTGTVTASTLNIRSEPNTSSTILGTLSNGNVINIIQDMGNGWLKMSYEAIPEGYVYASYVSVSKTTTGDYYAYADVDFRFVMGRKRTLHVTAAEGTSAADAQTFANDLAALVSRVGVVESFSGPFRPDLHVGDNAQINSSSGQRLLGMITSISHKFGKSGFSTDFTVDSGMVANKMRISDYISKISGEQKTGNAERLY